MADENKSGTGATDPAFLEMINNRESFISREQADEIARILRERGTGISPELVEILREREQEGTTVTLGEGKVSVDKDGDGKPEITVKGKDFTVEVDKDGDGEPDITIESETSDPGFKFDPRNFPPIDEIPRYPEWMPPREEFPKLPEDTVPPVELFPKLPEDYTPPEGGFKPHEMTPEEREQFEKWIEENIQKLPEFHGDPGIFGPEIEDDPFPKRMPSPESKLFPRELEIPDLSPEENSLKIDTDGDGVTDVTVKGDDVTVELDIDDDGVTDVTIRKEGDKLEIDADGDGEPETTIIAKDITYGVDVDGDGITDITIQNKAPEPGLSRLHEWFEPKTTFPEWFERLPEELIKIPDEVRKAIEGMAPGKAWEDHFNPKTLEQIGNITEEYNAMAQSKLIEPEVKLDQTAPKFEAEAALIGTP